MNIDNDPFGISGAFDDDITPVEATPPKGTREHRQEPRFRARWKIIVVIEGQDFHDGQIKDISAHGASILVGRNLIPSTKVKLCIDIPSLTGHGKPRTIVVQGRTVYTVHDGENMTFRVGIHFNKFTLASDRSYLEARLTEHHQTIR